MAGRIAHQIEYVHVYTLHAAMDMDAGELEGLSAEELMAKKDLIEAEIKAQQETLELV